MREAIGYRLGVALTLPDLGDVHRHAARPELAREAWQRAVAIFDELHHRAGVADAEQRLRSLGAA